MKFYLVWANPATRRKSWSLGALALSLAAHLALAPSISGDWPEPLRQAAELTTALLPLVLTWFVLDVFLDRPERQAIFSPAFGLAGIAVLACALDLGPWYVQALPMLLLYAGLIAVLMHSGRGDLVEGRRGFRVIFASLILVYAIGWRMIEIIYLPGLPSPWMDTGHVAFLFVMMMVFAGRALEPGLDLWAEELPRGSAAPAADVTAADAVLVARVRAAMEDELWRREGLTIGGMADELSVPEHRLRKAINRDLGYRNFPAFVNGYRINAAKAALLAPENLDKTILEIAYDCGFGSLAPFNKAFRAMTGQSPRDYRRDRLVNDAAVLA
ncbi:helix-turn-helix domain-containing protein [Roseovarius sp. C7]|uniref:AraC family transcriptional regulator n=1 Tax=Roseovarius sp. C7 TaxID=3398643 RepID=UPI0039F709D4